MPISKSGWGNENCYMFAANNPCNKVVDPGGLSNVNFAIGVDPAPARKAVMADGASYHDHTKFGGGVPAVGAKAGHYLIAMKQQIGPAENYHFVRRDEETGIWWQKVPMSAAGMVDEDAIAAAAFVPHTDEWTQNPRLRRGSPLDIWVGYFWVPDGGLRAAPVKRKCFIMSATCAALGKPEDAGELEALKWFRDHVMIRDPEGKKELRRYYATAPHIVAAIARSPDSKAAYEEIYGTWLVPAVAAIERRDFAGARAIYDEALRCLTARHLGS